MNELQLCVSHTKDYDQQNAKFSKSFKIKLFCNFRVHFFKEPINLIKISNLDNWPCSIIDNFITAALEIVNYSTIISKRIQNIYSALVSWCIHFW